jgi:signal transduction histidine kinase
VIDSTYRVLYQSGLPIIEGELEKHPGIAEAFTGESGTAYVQNGNDEHVVAYSPVAALDWAILTEESWEAVTNPTLQASLMTPLVLVPALLLAALALWFGAEQIVKPLRALETKAAKLAWGDFKEIEAPVYGIAEIRHLQAELVHMARQLQAAQQSLHSYIGAITKGQEEERLRLARDLHDDTIQSVIALKQRVQLARMALPKDASPAALAELESLAEQTIENLRRTTRALRPIYLEELGLLAALEMLASETAQNAGLHVDFHHTGNERRLPADVELALYRMAQEALNNTVRHAQATHASVSIEFKLELVTLRVSDNGIGFEAPKSPAEFVPGSHFGLVGLYERAQLIGARLEIESTPGKGTHLNVYLPASDGNK